MNAIAIRTLSISALLGGILLCCTGCEGSSTPNVPDSAWTPNVPALQPDAVNTGEPTSPDLNNAALDVLLDETSAPTDAVSSNAADLIAAHPDAYNELLDGGDTTLRHIVRTFLGDSQTGPRAEVMLALMVDLLGEEAPLVEAEISNPGALASANAQTRFDAWFAAAGILLDRHGLDFMRENMPRTYTVVTAMQG